ncbi:MAG: DMT family transporter [Clostridia bacterium]|nr:DMT family transporter [Clostridia bacterium]
MGMLLGYLYIIVGALGLGLNTMLVKMVYSHGILPNQLLLIQYILSMILFWVLAMFKKDVIQLPKGNILQIFIVALGDFAGVLTFYYALKFLDAGLVTMLFFTFPIYVILLVRVFFKERITAAQGISLALTILGTALALDILNLDFHIMPLAGVLLGFGAAFAVSFVHVYAQHVLKEARPLTVSLYTVTFMAVFTFFIQNPMNLMEIAFSGEMVTLILLITLIGGFLPKIFLFAGLKLIGAARVSIVGVVELPFALVMSFYLLGESLLPVQILGAVLIFAGVIFLQLGDLRKYREPSQVS